MKRVGVLWVLGMFAACSGQTAPRDTARNGSSTETPASVPAAAASTADSEPTTGVKAPTATPLSCDERVKQLEVGLGQEPTALRVPMGVEPSEVAAWREITELGPVLTISGSDEIRFEGEPLSRSEIMLRLENLGDERGSVPLFVMADRRATARLVYTIIKGHPKKLVPHLVVARDKIADPSDTIQLPVGSATWVAEWLTQYRGEDSHSKRARQLQSGIVKAAGTECQELSTAFKTIASAFGQSREVAAIEIPRALAACGCGGVDPGFEMILTLSRSRPDSLGQLPLGKQPPSSLSAEATAFDLARALSASLSDK